ncbi:hypothetical protein CAZ29_26695 [Pseudomonas aeruginosa]|nr:hypothetical protein CAZ29_26695 [Pseudomonas aeruginosa]
MKKILLLIPLAFAASLAWFVWLEPSPAPENPASYTPLRAHETGRKPVCRLLFEQTKPITTH